MKRLLLASTFAVLFTVGGPAFGQATKDQSATQEMKERARSATKDTDVTFGRIKELTPGQKIVVDIDDAPDKTFELASKDVAVHLGKGLKVGDPVQVKENEVLGKTKSVTISKHSDSSVTHGDKDPNKK